MAPRSAYHDWHQSRRIRRRRSAFTSLPLSLISSRQLLAVGARVPAPSTRAALAAAVDTLLVQLYGTTTAAMSAAVRSVYVDSLCADAGNDWTERLVRVCS